MQITTHASKKRLAYCKLTGLSTQDLYFENNFCWKYDWYLNHTHTYTHSHTHIKDTYNIQKWYVLSRCLDPNVNSGIFLLKAPINSSFEQSRSAYLSHFFKGQWNFTDLLSSKYSSFELRLEVVFIIYFFNNIFFF